MYAKHLRHLLPLLFLPFFFSSLSAQNTQHVDSIAFVGYNGSFEIIHFDNYLVTSLGQVFDVFNPASPNLIGSFAPPNGVVTAYHYERPYLFVGTGMVANLLIVDMSFPFAPNPVATMNFGQGDIFGITVSGDHAYLAAGNTGLVSIDISTLSAPVAVDTLPFPNQVRDVGTSGCQVFVSGAGGLNNVDISDPTNLSLISGYGTGFVDLKNYGDTVFVSGTTGALQVISFDNPTNPLPLAGASTGMQMWGIDFRDGMIYASSNTGDMYAYELTYPSLTPFAFFNGSAGQGFDVVSNDSIIFLSSLVQGIHFLQLDTVSPIQVPYAPLFKPCNTGVGVEESLLEPGIWVPNPVRDRGKLMLSPEMNLFSPADLVIWNMEGKKVGKWTVEGLSEIEVDATPWPPGLYWYELLQEGRRVDKGKIVVQ